mgnify:FL=1
MAFDQMNIKDMLCDMYDIQRKVKETKVTYEIKGHDLEIALYDAPKDNDGTIFTLKDCFDNVIGQLEQELERRGEEIN